LSQVHGSARLLPSELRQLRDHLISSNDVRKFQLFVLLLTSIELFLRKKEFTQMHEDHCKQNMSIFVAPSTCDNLLFAIHGKRKKAGRRGAHQTSVIRNMYMWGDDTCQDLDLKRLLLAHLCSINWKGGCIFPSWDEIRDPPEDGVHVTTIKESEMHRELNALCTDLLQREDKLGTHTGRKSAHLWAFLRGACLAQCLDAAGHESLIVGRKHCSGAEAHMSVNHCHHNVENSLGPFKPPMCSGDENSVWSAFPGRQWQVSLPDLVTGFMEQVVGIDPLHHPACSPICLHQQVHAWRKPTDDPLRRWHSLLSEVNRDRSNEMRACVQQLQLRAVEARTRELQASHQEQSARDLSEIFVSLRRSGVANNVLASAFGPFLPQLPGLASPSNGLRAGSSATGRRRGTNPNSAGQPAPKKQRGGNRQLPSCAGMRKWSAEQKLQFMVDVCDPNTSSCRDADRQWLVKSNPIAHCFEQCCGSDVPRFLQLHNGGQDNFSIEAVCKSKLAACGHCHRSQIPCAFLLCCFPLQHVTFSCM